MVRKGHRLTGERAAGFDLRDEFPQHGDCAPRCPRCLGGGVYVRIALDGSLIPFACPVCGGMWERGLLV